MSVLKGVPSKNDLTVKAKPCPYNIKDDFKINLYIYNESSYPARIHKKICTGVTHPPPEVIMVIKGGQKSLAATEDKNKGSLRALLDSGGSTNFIRARAVKI